MVKPPPPAHVKSRPLLRLIKLLILIGFGTLLPLIAIEIGFRIFSDGARKSGWDDRPNRYFIAEEASSLQGNHTTVEKPPQTFRTIVIGDSITFAPFMQYWDAFPARLERMLNLNKTSQRAEVLNFGFPGFSTADEVAILHKAIELKPDLIILQITLNDPELKALRRNSHNLFGAYTPTEELSRVLRYWKSLGWALQRIHNAETHQHYREYFNELFNNPENWGNFSQSLERIIELSRKKGIKLVPVIFPLFGYTIDKSYPFNHLHEKIGSELKRLGSEYLDLRKTFWNVPNERLHVIPYVDMHPNEIAHRMASEAIYTFLKRNNLVPQELIAHRQYDQRVSVQSIALESRPTPSEPHTEMGSAKKAH